MKQEAYSLQPIYQINLHCSFRHWYKQSVEDVERLFSDPMITWMESKGQNFEVTYLRSAILNCIVCDMYCLSFV